VNPHSFQDLQVKAMVKAWLSGLMKKGPGTGELLEDKPYFQMGSERRDGLRIQFNSVQFRSVPFKSKIHYLDHQDCRPEIP